MRQATRFGRAGHSAQANPRELDRGPKYTFLV